MHKPLSPMSHRAHIGLRFTQTPPEGGENTPQGGAGGANPPAPASPPAGTPPPAGTTFNQDDLNRVATREKAEGRQAAEKAIVDQLGCTIDEAKAIVEKARQADDAAKTESQRDRDAAAKEKADAEADRQAAKKEVHDARLERAFSAVGVDLSDDKAKDKNARLLRMVTVQVGASYDEVAADVKAIQKDFPALFTTSPGKGNGRPGAPAGDPAGTPPTPTPGEGNFEAGRKRAQARYAGRTAEEETNPLLRAARSR